LPRENHAGLAVIGDGHEMGTILLHARAILDENEVQNTVIPPRPGFLERPTGYLLHRLAVPALIGRPSLLERLVGGGDVLLVGRRLTPVASPGAEQSENEREEDHRADDDQDDGERGDGDWSSHDGASVYGVAESPAARGHPARARASG
jgi:hypothetical protein